MKHLNTLLIVLTVTLFASCEFVNDSFTFKDKTKEFFESMMKEDYEGCISQMALQRPGAKNFNRDTFRAGIHGLKTGIEQHFGNGKFNYSLIRSEKKRSTVDAENTPSNTTRALIEFSNDKDFGVFEVLFDDQSKKIVNIGPLDIKKPIPNMLYFWLFGLLPATVLAFNIHVIRKIKKSNLTKKGWKYAAVVILNLPAISYAAISGLSFSLLNFQIMLGISFSLMGYLGSVWTFGIPMGGIYWWWKLRKAKEDAEYNEQIEALYQSKNIDNQVH